jgi:RimJ/RimL family protein N-acetyltransferase
MSCPLPTFRTSRLIVRPRTFDDLEACIEMDRDPLVTRFIAGPWLDPIAHRAFIEGRMRHTYPAGMGYWSVIASERLCQRSRQTVWPAAVGLRYRLPLAGSEMDAVYGMWLVGRFGAV